MFIKNGRVAVNMSHSGLIRIDIGRIEGQLLQTRIRRLSFTPIQQYNPWEASIAVENTQEVREAMRALGAVEPIMSLAEHIVDPAPNLPHVAASMEDITMDEALDEIAKRFRGIIMYGECSDAARVFQITFRW